MKENISKKEDRVSYQIGVQFKKPLDYCAKFIDNLLPNNKILVLPLPQNLVTPKYFVKNPSAGEYHFYTCPDTSETSKFIWKIMRNGLAKSVLLDEIRCNC